MLYLDTDGQLFDALVLRVHPPGGQHPLLDIAFYPAGDVPWAIAKVLYQPDAGGCWSYPQP